MIRWIDLNPARGAETRKKRPCVVLQSDMMNRETRTVIVAPILPNHKDWPFVVNVTPTKKNGLDKDRHINLKQLRAIDISRIGNRQGLLEEHYFKSIKETIAIILGLA
ncbi:MAG: type II toxin-antitoxin system PemK/MazF family toxin [Candidatus Scalindua sp.]